MHDYNETKRDPVHKEIKRRFHYLHEKLSHIKRLVLEYDTQNCGGGMTSSSNANGTNEIKEMDSLHYWHKLKRPPLIFNLFSIVGTLLSSLSQNLHFLGMFQGWSKTVHMVPGSVVENKSQVLSEPGLQQTRNLHAVVKNCESRRFLFYNWFVRATVMISSTCAFVWSRAIVVTRLRATSTNGNYIDKKRGFLTTIGTFRGKKRKWKKKKKRNEIKVHPKRERKQWEKRRAFAKS